MNRMKHKKNLWSDVSILVVAVLAITALVRGVWQFRLLGIVFAAMVGMGWLSSSYPVPQRDQTQQRGKKSQTAL